MLYQLSYAGARNLRLYQTRHGSRNPAAETLAQPQARDAKFWSGRRGSNSQHSAWKADTLPIELLPLTRGRNRRSRNRHRHLPNFPFYESNRGRSILPRRIEANPPANALAIGPRPSAQHPGASRERGFSPHRALSDSPRTGPGNLRPFRRRNARCAWLPRRSGHGRASPAAPCLRTSAMRY